MALAKVIFYKSVVEYCEADCTLLNRETTNAVCDATMHHSSTKPGSKKNYYIINRFHD